MKRAFLALALAAAWLLPAGMASPADAQGWKGHGRGKHYRHHGHRHRQSHWGHSYWGHAYRPRVRVSVGPAFYWGPSWYYGPPPTTVYRERVIVAEPPVYIERQPAAASSGWWYYCESAGAYYPDVPSCPESWVKVPPRVE